MDSNLDLDTLREIERDLVRRHFSEFVRSAWRHIDPAPLVWGVHMDALCSVLQAIAERRLQRIIINVPPGYAKSMLVAVLFPAWRWLRRPSWSILSASHSLQLSTRDAVKTRALMDSEWYKDMVRGAWTMRDDDNTKTLYKNSQGGIRQALSVSGGNTGWRGDCVSGSTLVSTEVGPLPIAAFEHLQNWPRVWSYNHTKAQLELRRVEAFRRIENRQTITIHTKAGRVLQCTGDHKIYAEGIYQTAQSTPSGAALYVVPKELSDSTICNHKTSEEKSEQLTLLQSHLRGTPLQQVETDAVLQDLCSEAAEESQEVLQSRVLAQATDNNKALPSMRDSLHGVVDSHGLLQSNVCRCSSLTKNDGRGQFTFQERNQSKSVVSKDATSGVSEGRAHVCSLLGHRADSSGCIESERANDSSSAPHRPQPKEQQSGESDSTVRKLSRRLSHPIPRRELPGLDSVHSVSSDGAGTVAVYDLQVEGNCNFFANEILVHNCLVIDDALDAKAAYSELKREEAVLWKTITMSTRFNDMERAEEIIIGQRLHEEDLPGYLLKHEGRGKWAHLNLPGEFEPDARAVVKDIHGKLIWEDPRKEAGELLFPAKFSAKVMKDLKLALGPYGYAGQIQQRPTPADGGLLKREWFSTRWAAPGTTPPTGMQCVPLPKAFSEMTIVADCAFKKTDTSDKVAIGVWGRQGTSLFLLDLRWERMTFTETLQAFLDLKAKWPKANKVIIEDKANGTAIIDVLRSRIPGVVPVQPDGGKEARIAASTPKWAAGNVVLPLQAPWVADFIEEAVSFPRAPHDDAIDMAAYAISAMLQNSNLSWLEAINKGL